VFKFGRWHATPEQSTFPKAMQISCIPSAFGIQIDVIAQVLIFGSS
jgi:hypothetical protein